MTDSNFEFLKEEFPILFNIASSAEHYLHSDPVAALFKLRQFGEKLTAYILDVYGLDAPAEDTFHNRIKILEDEGVFQANVASLLHNIKHRGNVAVHQSRGSIDDAKTILFSAFKVAKWFYESFSEQNRDVSSVKFSMPAQFDARQALDKLEKEYALETRFNELLVAKEAAQLTTQQKQNIRARAEKSSRKIDLDEAETREIIDAWLRHAGWEADSNELNFKTRRTLPAKGRNLAIAEWKVGDKWADYALFIGTQLYGIVEAKKYAHDISTDLRQSKIYAEKAEATDNAQLLGEWANYKVPFLFSTNGRPYLEQIKTKSGIWFLDVRRPTNISRPLEAWYSPSGMQELFSQDIDRANTRLKAHAPDFLTSRTGLGLREYQIKAIEKVEEVLVTQPNRRRVLLAMATGTGKTRTIIGLCYRLIQSNRFRRILFLVDRTALGIQAINAFKDNKIDDLKTFADIYQIEEMRKMIPDVDTRLHFATVQSMVKRLFYKDEDEEEVPTVDTYDCLIVDEAHRGYLLDRSIDDTDLEFKNQDDYVSKYRRVLDYFDAFAVGLTATPALHTTDIFGKPIYNYGYREAVIDGYLVDHEPPFIIKTKLSEDGIAWQKGEKPKVYNKETNKIEELAELEDELKLDIDHFNKLVLTTNFNRTVVKQLVQHLDPEGEEKTIVFAASDSHADQLVDLFKEEFAAIGIEPGDNAIAKITANTYDPIDLITRFKNEKFPNIAVTVDLLTTGIDVPAICNLVFMRRVRSRILYEQMLGRATRLCPSIKKESFRIFDAVRIYEALKPFTQMTPVLVNPKITFGGLVNEFPHLEEDEGRQIRQIEQIIAKLQRKKIQLKGDSAERFAYASGGKDVEDYIEMIRSLPPKEAVKEIVDRSELWKFLDEFKPAPARQLYSEHEDEARPTERGYGNAKRPEDYISNFKKYLEENANRIAAIKMIRTNPTQLDRQSLKELYLALDAAGFTNLSLRQAWKEVKNEDVAADIISFIRTLSLGADLQPHETRIRNAVDKIRRSRDWNKVQLKWLDRFEAQLIHESILQKEDLDKPPFKDEGGFARLNRIFGNELQQVLTELNRNLYSDQQSA
jgi:type I restriction enzyme R subunit